jgi:hypothetical protein
MGQAPFAQGGKACAQRLLLHGHALRPGRFGTGGHARLDRFERAGDLAHFIGLVTARHGTVELPPAMSSIASTSVASGRDMRARNISTTASPASPATPATSMARTRK